MTAGTSPISSSGGSGGVGLEDAVHAYVKQSSQFYHDLATTPLLPASTPPGVSKSISMAPPTLSNVTLNHLTTAVESLSLRLGRLESIVAALDASRRSTNTLGSTTQRIHDEGLIQAAVTPLAHTLEYHERLLIDVATAVQELNRDHQRHVDRQQAEERHRHGLLSDPQQPQPNVASGGGGGPTTVPSPTTHFATASTATATELQASIDRMTKLAAVLQHDRRSVERTAAPAPHQDYPAQASTAAVPAVAETPPVQGVGTVAAVEEETQVKTDHEASAAPDGVVPSHTSADSTVSLDHLSGVEPTATTVVPLAGDMSRTYHADVSGLSGLGGGAAAMMGRPGPFHGSGSSPAATPMRGGGSGGGYGLSPYRQAGSSSGQLLSDVYHTLRASNQQALSNPYGFTSSEATPSSGSRNTPPHQMPPRLVYTTTSSSSPFTTSTPTTVQTTPLDTDSSYGDHYRDLLSRLRPSSTAYQSHRYY